MEPPVCPSCGKKHWARVCPENVTKPVTDVTIGVTGRVVPSTVAPSKLIAAKAEIERLTDEVAYLKRQLAERPPLKVPLTAAERQRRRRSKGNAG